MASATLATGSRAGSPQRKRTPSDWRRLARRRRNRLEETLLAAEAQLADAERLGCRNDIERLRADIYGRDYVDFAEGLIFEIRAIDVAVRDQRVVQRCAELGITVTQLVDYQRRHDRAHGPAPDENPAATGSPYRGNRWRSTLGRGGTGAVAR